MHRLTERLLAGGSPLERVVGHARGSEPGPLLLVVGGIHGNEPAGVLAARRVLERLARDATPVRGDFVALSGNLGALRRGERYLERDLNRGWTGARLRAPVGPGPEDREQQALLAAIEVARAAARGPVHFLDLHTTSAPGIPFVMVRDLPPQLEFALHFPLPILLGLLELVDSTLLEWMRGLGCITLGIEAGQNATESSVDHHAAALWIALVTAGLVRTEDVPDLPQHRALLAAARGRLPHVMAVESRHAIGPEDGFTMVAGFTNIQRVGAGELLAHDHHGEIRAPRECLLLLPLYQAQGDDGFFLGRELEVFQRA